MEPGQEAWGLAGRLAGMHHTEVITELQKLIDARVRSEEDFKALLSALEYILEAGRDDLAGNLRDTIAAFRLEPGK